MGSSRFLARGCWPLQPRRTCAGGGGATRGHTNRSRGTWVSGPALPVAIPAQTWPLWSGKGQAAHAPSVGTKNSFPLDAAGRRICPSRAGSGSELTLKINVETQEGKVQPESDGPWAQRGTEAQASEGGQAGCAGACPCRTLLGTGSWDPHCSVHWTPSVRRKWLLSGGRREKGSVSDPRGPREQGHPGGPYLSRRRRRRRRRDTGQRRGGGGGRGPPAQPT